MRQEEHSIILNYSVMGSAQNRSNLNTNDDSYLSFIYISEHK